MSDQLALVGRSHVRVALGPLDPVGTLRPLYKTDSDGLHPTSDGYMVPRTDYHKHWTLVLAAPI